MPDPARPLLVIDGDSFAHRAYHALPKSIRRAGGKGGGAIVGFANYLLRLHEAEAPRAVVVGWDTLEAPNWRVKLFPPYQGDRDIDAELIDQLDLLPDFVRACGFVAGRQAGYEADDFLAAAVSIEERRGGTALVASGDRDAFQLVSSRTTLLYPVKGGELARIDVDEVRQRYGVEPHQVPDFIALRGDSSDRIPGARGVGPATAASLLKRHADLEAMIVADRFPAQAEDLLLYKRIATMDPEAPLPDLPDTVPDWRGGAAWARHHELNGLADRLDKLAATG